MGQLITLNFPEAHRIRRVAEFYFATNVGGVEKDFQIREFVTPEERQLFWDEYFKQQRKNGHA